MERGANGRHEEGGPLVVEGVELVSGWGRPSQPGSLTLLKAPRMVPRYRELVAGFTNPKVVELGISQGGSVALLALLARPERMVAFDLAETPVAPLLQFIEDHGFADTVEVHFGVDQADRARLAAIVDQAFGAAPLDLVIDDASHLYGPTVASFEVLFPRLRPGGLYVIEDWNWQDLFAHGIAAAMADTTRPDHDEMMARLGAVVAGRAEPEIPLSLFAPQLTLVRAQTDVIADIVIDQDWISVRRGDRELDHGAFRVADLYTDHFGVLRR